MNKIFTFIAVALLILSSNSFAEEEDSNQKIALYIHPGSLIISTFTSVVVREPNFYVELTGEIPLGKYASLVLVPSAEKLNFSIVEDTKLLKAGSGIGVRLFPNGKTDGFYFQLMPGMYYVRENWERDWGHIKNKRSGIYADALGYLGYALKFPSFSAFFDIGAGLAYSKLSGTSRSYDGKVSDCDYKEIDPAVDIHFGIGVPIF